MTPAEMREMAAKELWRNLLEKGDRTSPAEYPDMALITFDEFRDAIAALHPIPIPDTTAADNALEMAREALEPFARAISAVENYDPLVPDEMAALRASFDYWTRQLGMNNDEVVTRDSVRVSDLRRARVVLAAIDARIAELKAKTEP